MYPKGASTGAYEDDYWHLTYAENYNEHLLCYNVLGGV